MKGVATIVIGLVLFAWLAAGFHGSMGTREASAQAEGAPSSGFDAVVVSNAERTMREGQEASCFDGGVEGEVRELRRPSASRSTPMFCPMD